MASTGSQSDSSVSQARREHVVGPGVDALLPLQAPPAAVPAPVVPMVQAPVAPLLAPITIRPNRENYPYWRSQVIPAVRAHECNGFLFGTRPCPPQYLDPPADPNPLLPRQVNPQFTLWIRTDQAILSWLLNSISEAMMGHVLRCQFSRDVWVLLESLFTTQSRARILQLRFQLQSLKNGSLSIHDYILKMKTIADGLTAAGQVFSDDDLILYILGGLGPEYDSVVINLTSRGDRLTLSEVQFLLQSQ
ncbi:uncharacterized protein LOC133779204 [Humulus lupulus]|uniref:uncharacterized protein LOC133779204 n=1 Tax=Humulus lupulus TaxID=3486 RepID=UPI002B403A38|nr:uncharacterized protein LOC133779204 [Humulus lupulus]